MGSVKDLDNNQKPTQDAMGTGRFRFSNRYSVLTGEKCPTKSKAKGQLSA